MGKRESSLKYMLLVGRRPYRLHKAYLLELNKFRKMIQKRYFGFCASIYSPCSILDQPHFSFFMLLHELEKKDVAVLLIAEGSHIHVRNQILCPLFEVGIPYDCYP